MELDYEYINPSQLKYQKNEEVVFRYIGTPCNPMHLSIGIGPILKVKDNSKPYVIVNNKGVVWQADDKDILCSKKDFSIEQLESELTEAWKKKVKSLEKQLEEAKQIYEIVKKDSKKICQTAVDAGCDIDYRFV